MNRRRRPAWGKREGEWKGRKRGLAVLLSFLLLCTGIGTAGIAAWGQGQGERPANPVTGGSLAQNGEAQTTSAAVVPKESSPGGVAEKESPGGTAENPSTAAGATTPPAISTPPAVTEKNKTDSKKTDESKKRSKEKDAAKTDDKAAVSSRAAVKSSMAAAALNEEVVMGLVRVNNLYNNYHVAGITNLPQHFIDHGTGVQFYHTKATYKAIYCMETWNLTLESLPDEFDAPDKSYTDEQLKLLGHVLGHGPQFFLPDNEKAIKRQAATQLAVWAICEDILNDSAAMDAVLFPVTGGDAKGDEAFAQTPEVGRMARKMVEAAQQALASGTVDTPHPIPSFASKDPNNPAKHVMKKNPNASAYRVELIDTTGFFAEDWENGMISLKDEGRMHISVSGSALTIEGHPGDQGRVITLNRETSGGTVKYLRNMAAGHESAQRMARFAQHENEDTLYLALTIDASTDTSVPLTVKKNWDDAANPAGRPTDVQVQLYKDGNAEGNPVTLNASGGWTHTWNNLASGHQWTVDEINVPPGYTKTTTSSNNGTTFTITNTIGGTTPQTTHLTAKKVWAGDTAAKRPKSVKVQLMENGKAHGDSVTLNASNGWTHTWKDLAADKTWTVDEVKVPDGYKKTIYRVGTEYSIINTADKPNTPEKPNKPNTPDKPVTTNKTNTPGTPGTGDNTGFYGMLVAALVAVLAGGLFCGIRFYKTRKREGRRVVTETGEKQIE